jgi:hypothetical protein
MDSVIALAHAPVAFQLPTMSPPHGATFPQLPLPLLPHVDSTTAAPHAARAFASPPIPRFMGAIFSPVEATGK